ncbi:HNH endonuclease [Priestia megaterium]
MEEWKIIKKPKVTFKVSNQGRIQILNEDKNEFEMVKGFSYTGGHEGSRYFSTHGYYVHRLVAEAWIGPIEGMEVNHKDGRKTCNDVSNLEIVTPQENHRHSWDIGLRDNQKLSNEELSRRERELFNKQWAVYDLNFNIIQIYNSQNEALKSVGVSRQAANRSYRKGRPILRKYYICRLNQKDELRTRVVELNEGTMVL